MLSHLQKRPVLRLLLLHLFQQLVQFLSQLDPQLRLSDEAQRGGERGAQREHVALRGTGRGRGRVWGGDKSTTHSRLEALDAARESAECSVVKMTRENSLSCGICV